MTSPHEVISELLSTAHADVLEDAGRSAWASAGQALAGIFETAPTLDELEARLVMPDEIVADFAGAHLVLPIEASTSDDQSATAWLVVGTAEAAHFLNSEADSADDQEQQTIVMASTVLGQAIRAINAETFGESPKHLVLSLDDVTADSMPGILNALEDPCLVLTGRLSQRGELKVWVVLPGSFLEVAAGGFESGPASDVAADIAPEATTEPAAGMPVEAGEADDEPGDDESRTEPTPIVSRRVASEPEDEEPRPLRPAPTAHRAQFGPLTAASAGQAPTNIDLLAGLEMNVSVELGRTEMTVADVLSLGPGSVVELDRLAGEPVDILVNDRLIARGEVVVVDENFGVRVVEVIRRGNREEAAG